MERKVSLLIIGSLLIVGVSLAGFYSSYLQYFPDFSRFPFHIHFHFTVFLAWFALLILQPILIKRRNYKLHSLIGKVGYVLVPILVISIVFAVWHQVRVMYPKNPELASITAFVGLLDAFSLLVYYSISMMNKKNMRWHVAFIIACSLVILNPGLSRLLNALKPGLGMMGAILLPIVVSVMILIYERSKYKYALVYSPYFLFLCCWVFEVFLLFTVPHTALWQEVVLGIAVGKYE